ncbi:MAG: hypothetical protein IKZ45_07160 [Fibrobacter sp.]|nr:hypothetical protein [Fibrobacter sp.]
MGGFFFWLAVVVCVVALVLLFFPFRFKIEFEAGEHGCRALFFFFKKKLWTGEKQWGKKKKDAGEGIDEGKAGADYLDGDSSDKDVDDSASESTEPEFVATAPAKPVEKKAAEVEPPKASEPPANAPTGSAAETPKADSAPVQDSTPVQDVAPVQDAPEAAKKAEEPEPEKKEKPKLTDEQFWTIILTPELDGRAFRYLKSFLGMAVRLFKIKFVNCFVEGIRGDYESMGYGAALNAVFKGFPYLRAWDFRMDWCRDHELHAQGEIHARTNLCRVLFLSLAMFVYAGILFLLFWRRRSHVLKTGELPELGFIRKKIVGWMVEE